nr:response regulator [Methylogaea oryzae]
MSDLAPGKARIFIVDDKAANLRRLEEMLTEEGYGRIVLIADSRQVLDRYQEARPDLILLAIHLRHRDGFEVMRQIKALRDPLSPPIVMLAGRRGENDLVQALAAGASDLVAKPFDGVALLLRVRNLLAAQLAHRSLHAQKAVLEASMRGRTEDVSRSALQVVHRLGRAVGYRDSRAGPSIARIGEYSALLAEAAGWSSADCELMWHASSMHDIGNIGIPDTVLFKPGKFEPHEWAIMKNHAAIGAYILEDGDSDLLRMAHAIALNHHEKWDAAVIRAGWRARRFPWPPASSPWPTCSMR